MIVLSHTILFTINCIHGTVLLRFDLILWQLGKQSISTLSRLYSIRFGLIERVIFIKSFVICNDWIHFDFDSIFGPIYYSRPATESEDSVAKSIESFFFIIFSIKYSSNLIFMSITGKFELVVDVRSSWDRSYRFHLHF